MSATTYSPTRTTCSTIGSAGLNFRVRDGNGWTPHDIATDFVSRRWQHPGLKESLLARGDRKIPTCEIVEDEASQLNRLVKTYYV